MRRAAAALAAAALAAAALLLLGACNGDDGGDEPSIEGVDAAALLASAADRMERVKSFAFVLEHEGGATEIVRGLLMERAEGEVVGTDQLRVDVRGRFLAFNVNTGIVVIGDDAWFQNPLTGRWEREEISIADVFDPASGVTALMRLVSDPRVTGAEKVGGVSTYRVEATVDSGDVTLFGDPRPGFPLRAYAWIGVGEPLVYRIELVGAITDTEEAGLVRRLTLSRFDADIEIAPPR